MYNIKVTKRKKILVRAGMSPLEQLSVERILTDNLLGNNNGNLMYQFSIFRNLQTPNTELIPNRYNSDPAQAGYINENYSHLVLPFANAFKDKPSARRELINYTKLIKRLNIPVTIVGIGIQAPMPRDGQKIRYPFDNEARELIKAVLEKSPIVGVRGELTADYLTSLGFKPGRDHTVIGCPSMYTFGRKLNIRQAKVNDRSLVYVNSVDASPKHASLGIIDFVNKSMIKNKSHIFVPTNNADLYLTYTGTGKIDNVSSYYPSSMLSPVYADGRVRFPINVASWIKMLRRADFVYGARLHGCIAATLAGTPSLMFIKDLRMKELAEYHGLTCVYPNDIKNKTTLEELIARADFNSSVSKQAANFDHFIDFLNENRLEHIFEDPKVSNNPPFDQQLKQIKVMDPIKTTTIIRKEEVIDRQYRVKNAIQQKHKQDISVLKNNYKSKINRQAAKIKEYRKRLNRRSVKAALLMAKLLGGKFW